MNQPTYISIGIPFYNADSYLEDAICSVLAQTYSYWELILVDDGSTDRSLEIAEQYAATDERIRVISDGKNKRLAARLNQIIIESKYDYIARMDADDLMSNDRLEKQLSILRNNPNKDFVTSGYLTINKNNKITGIRILENHQMTADRILSGSTNLVHASLVARKSWYNRNKYNENRVLAQDYELWLIAAKNNDLNYIVVQEPLYWYRATENVTYEKLISGYNAQIKIISKHYQGVISKFKKNKVITKFVFKKIVVRILNKLDFIDILLKKRSEGYDSINLMYYQVNIENIMKIKGEK